MPQSALDSGRVQRVRELLRALPVSADARKAMCAQALHHRECTLSRKPARIGAGNRDSATPNGLHPRAAAFLIMVHDARANSTTAAALQESSSGLAVLDLLLSLLWSPDNVYAVHVEPTAAPAYRAVLADVVARHGRGGHNVQLVAGARPVVWSGTSVVDGMLRGMRQLLRMSQRWELFVNLSGADFALHSADVLARRLAPLKRHNALWGNYVAATDQKTQTLLQKHVRETIVECRARIETLCAFLFLRRRVRSLNRIQRCPQVSLRAARPNAVPFAGKRCGFARKRNSVCGGGACVSSVATGHLWMVLERQFVDHLVRSAHAARLHRYFRFARVPDEKFFLTALVSGGSWSGTDSAVDTQLHSNRFKYTWLRKQTRFVKWIGENRPTVFFLIPQISCCSRGQSSHFASVCRAVRESSCLTTVFACAVVCSNDETTFDSLMASDKLFARKFTFSKSKHLLARLAATIMEETEER